jgi:hypothetical protein
MGFNDHIDFDLHEAIQDLLDEGMLEEGTPAHGIAQQVIHTGYDSLSPKQLLCKTRSFIAALTKRGEELKNIQISNSNPD